MDLHAAVALQHLTIGVSLPTRPWNDEIRAATTPVIDTVRTCPQSLETITIVIHGSPRDLLDFGKSLAEFPVQAIYNSLADGNHALERLTFQLKLVSTQEAGALGLWELAETLIRLLD